MSGGVGTDSAASVGVALVAGGTVVPLVNPLDGVCEGEVGGDVGTDGESSTKPGGKVCPKDGSVDVASATAAARIECDLILMQG